MYRKETRFNWNLILPQLGGEFSSQLAMTEFSSGPVFTIQTQMPDGRFIINDSQKIEELLQRQEEDVMTALAIHQFLQGTMT